MTSYLSIQLKKIRRVNSNLVSTGTRQSRINRLQLSNFWKESQKDDPAEKITWLISPVSYFSVSIYQRGCDVHSKFLFDVKFQPSCRWKSGPILASLQFAYFCAMMYCKSVYLHPKILQPRTLHPKILHPRILHLRTLHPRLLHPRILHPRILHPRILHPRILYPRILHPRILHPRILHPWMLHPRILHPRIMHPRILHPKILHPPSICDCITTCEHGIRICWCKIAPAIYQQPDAINILTNK